MLKAVSKSGLVIDKVGGVLLEWRQVLHNTYVYFSPIFRNASSS